jgi:hypothetical protein
VSLGSADELWSSSKDVASSPIKTFPTSADSPNLVSGGLRNASEQLENKTEYLRHNDLSYTIGHGKIKDLALHDMQNARAISDHVEYAGGKSKPIEKEKVIQFILLCKMLSLKLVNHRNHIIFVCLLQTDIDMVRKTSAATSRPAVENVVNTNEFIDKVTFLLNLQFSLIIVLYLMPNRICIQDYTSINVLVWWTHKIMSTDNRQTMFLLLEPLCCPSLKFSGQKYQT